MTTGRRLTIVAALTILLGSWSAARAQTGPALMLTSRPDIARKHEEIKSREAEREAKEGPMLLPDLGALNLVLTPRLDLSGEAVGVFDGGIEGRGGDLSVRTYEGQMRLGFFGTRGDPGLVFGSQIDVVEFDTSVAGIPDTLIDHSYAFGVRFPGEDKWALGMTGGVGFNGSSPYSDGDAWYGLATVFLDYRASDRERWTFGVDYNGNRSIFPDVPLPFVNYSNQLSETFRLDLGIPRIGIWWQPADNWTITADYFLPYTINAKVSYEVVEAWSLFGQFRNLFHGYRPYDSDDDNRRFFFQQRRIEAGIEWAPCANFSFVFAGGYAFDQELSRGFDGRNDDTLIEPTSEPYIRAALDLKF